MWGPPPVAQSGDHITTATGPTAHLAAPLPGPGTPAHRLQKQHGARAPVIPSDYGGSGTPVPRRRYFSIFSGASQPMAMPSRPVPQADPMHPWARPHRACLAVSAFTDSRVRWYATLVTAPALRYLPSNPDIWTTISGSGTDICRMRACNTHSKPRATRCNFCPMRPCRVPHTARCRAD